MMHAAWRLRASYRSLADMRCYACQAEVVIAATDRIGFREECEHCQADLHACANCRHHAPGASNECRESSAEPVCDRLRANLCEWFSPGSEAGRRDLEDERSAAMAELERLFSKD